MFKTFTRCERCIIGSVRPLYIRWHILNGRVHHLPGKGTHLSFNYRTAGVRENPTLTPIPTTGGVSSFTWGSTFITPYTHGPSTPAGTLDDSTPPARQKWNTLFLPLAHTTCKLGTCLVSKQIICLNTHFNWDLKRNETTVN